MASPQHAQDKVSVNIVMNNPKDLARTNSTPYEQRRSTEGSRGRSGSKLKGALMVPLDEAAFGRLVNRRNTREDVTNPNAEAKLTEESRNAYDSRILAVNKITKEEEDYLQGTSIYSQPEKISPRNS